MMNEEEHKEFNYIRRETGISAIGILRLGIKTAKEKNNPVSLKSGSFPNVS